MPGILETAVEKYLSSVVPPREGVLKEMEAYAREHDTPIIGPECGRLLYLLTQISGAKRIFEMGSAIGYSTTWFALAAGPGAEIYYTDSDTKNADMARVNLRRAGVLEQVHIMIGDAANLIDEVSGEFDIILIDVFKHSIPLR
jgi:predicted O-methyltransferase YrrM